MSNGFVQRFKGKINAALIYLNSSNGIVDAANGFTLLGGVPSDGLTAHAGGTQAAAIQLAYGWNRLSVVATLNDSAALPAALANAFCLVVNDGAAAAKIYGKNGGSDTIDGTAGSTGVALTNAKRTLFVCLTAGKWISLGTGESA